MARPVTLGLLNVSMAFKALAERRKDLLELVDEAGRGGCQIVLLPEFSDHHRTHEAFAAYHQGRAELARVAGLAAESPFIRELSALAVKHRMVVIPDVLWLEGARACNRCVVLGPEGRILGSYDKTHLAPGECDYFEAGTAAAPVATPFGRLGLLICYDINFPELTRCYELLGAELLLWTTMRQGSHEDALFRARLPGRAAEHGLPLGVATWVHERQHADRQVMSSAAWNALGQPIAGGLYAPGVVRATVDLDARPLTRRKWDAPEYVDEAAYLRRSRRPDLYGPLVRPLAPEERDLSREPAVCTFKDSEPKKTS